ncbi:hypothetical protein [Lyngbya aestuarii]|uniref:hypothetical protein n=1 Tax=Lyngbya aestuarii TaxID=118322 RepID=UPI00403D7522
MNSTQESLNKESLRDEVERLAEQAFHRKLISGYGDGEYSDEYQIVCDGKPRHYPLERARFILSKLIMCGRSS